MVSFPVLVAGLGSLYLACGTYQRTSEPTDSARGSEAACLPTSGECTTYPLCGCTSDKNCGPTAPGVVSCRPAGPSRLNEACTALDNCARGYSCFIDSRTKLGVCQPYCNDAATCPSGTCIPYAETPTAKLCRAECDPLDPNSCAPSGLCGFFGATTTGCSGAGTGTGAGGCTGAAACAPGYHCESTDSSCRKWCRLAKGTADCGGRECIAQGLSYRGTALGTCAR